MLRTPGRSKDSNFRIRSYFDTRFEGPDLYLERCIRLKTKMSFQLHFPDELIIGSHVLFFLHFNEGQFGGIVVVTTADVGLGL